MDVAVVGGGIVGVATALQLTRAGAQVTVFEAASRLGAGQTGHNSNVVHSGAFYAPGSLKATLATAGRDLLEDFIERNRLPIARPGKLIIQQKGEGSAFDELVRRATANGVETSVLPSVEALREVEPFANGERALWVPGVAITDFVAILAAMVDEISLLGNTVEFSAPCAWRGGQLVANDRHIRARHVIVAAGTGFNSLCPDRTWRIVGFRGSYRELRSPKPAHLVYGVPERRYPFLGVHVTPSLDGTVTVGPNATLHPPVPLGRSPLIAARNWRRGIGEMRTRFSSRAMRRDVLPYVPDAQLGPRIVKAGVRAQAVDRMGRYADDFVIVGGDDVTYVANAPSPAATACLAIGEHLAGRVLKAVR